MSGQRYLQLRRVIDLVIIVIALPVLVPVGGAAAAAIALIDRQRPLVHLGRSGHNGTNLRITKLRTMRGQPDQGSALTGSNDLRVTRLGARLRDWRIDEVPQVLDIVRGQMALIGPRPEDPAFVDAGDDRWKTVLSARPGIAGLSQIVAAPWEAEWLIDDVEDRYLNVALPAKLAIDAWYVRNASLRVDWLVVTSLAQMMLMDNKRTRAHDLIDEHIPEAAALCRAPAADRSEYG